MSWVSLPRLPPMAPCFLQNQPVSQPHVYPFVSTDSRRDTCDLSPLLVQGPSCPLCAFSLLLPPPVGSIMKSQIQATAIHDCHLHKRRGNQTLCPDENRVTSYHRASPRWSNLIWSAPPRRRRGHWCHSPKCVDLIWTLAHISWE